MAEETAEGRVAVVGVRCARVGPAPSCGDAGSVRNVDGVVAVVTGGGDMSVVFSFGVVTEMLSSRTFLVVEAAVSEGTATEITPVLRSPEVLAETIGTVGPLADMEVISGRGPVVIPSSDLFDLGAEGTTLADTGGGTTSVLAVTEGSGGKGGVVVA